MLGLVRDHIWVWDQRRREYLIPQAVTDVIWKLINLNVVVHIVSHIGVRGHWGHFHGNTGGKISQFLSLCQQWCRSSRFPLRLAEAGPGRGYIGRVTVATAKTSWAYPCRSLGRPYPEVVQTMDGKDIFVCKNQCCAIVEDHCGTALACLEIGAEDFFWSEQAALTIHASSLNHMDARTKPSKHLPRQHPGHLLGLRTIRIDASRTESAVATAPPSRSLTTKTLA